MHPLSLIVWVSQSCVSHILWKGRYIYQIHEIFSWLVDTCSSIGNTYAMWWLEELILGCCHFYFLPFFSPLDLFLASFGFSEVNFLEAFGVQRWIQIFQQLLYTFCQLANGFAPMPFEIFLHTFDDNRKYFFNFQWCHLHKVLIVPYIECTLSNLNPKL